MSGRRESIGVVTHLLRRISYVMHEKKTRGNYAVTVGFLDLKSAQDFHQWLVSEGKAIVDRESPRAGA